MTFPPNPSHYPEESALNRQIMREDYETNQERFREAPTERPVTPKRSKPYIDDDTAEPLRQLPMFGPFQYLDCSTCGREACERDVEIKGVTIQDGGKELVMFMCPNCGTLSDSVRTIR
jgi:hypothetical protein